MSADIYDEGLHNIINIDFSPIVVKAMQERYKDKIGMQCMVNSLSVLDQSSQTNGHAPNGVSRWGFQ